MVSYMLLNVIIIFAFASIGAGLGYIDDSFDEAKFSKKKGGGKRRCQ